MEDRRLLESHDGDLVGHAERIGQEFLEGFVAVERIDRPAITVFGSARLPEGDPVRVEGERHIARLENLAQHSGDPRGVGPGAPAAH